MPESKRPRSFKDALAKSRALSKKELVLLPRAFDIIGDIALLEIPDELLKKSKKIGEALLKFYPNVKVVARKTSAVKGELRTRSVEVVAGENRTVTEYKENGIRLKVDVENVYFSPRLANERLRLARLVKPGENVLVLFAGVGPFSILIAKMQPTTHVVSVELNPAATPLVLENIRLNKVAGRVEAIEGDAAAVLQEARFQKWADRIVMVLPERAHEFLEGALKAAKSGCTIHLYAFGSVKAGADTYGPSLRAIEEACEKAGRKFEVLYKGECGTYAPRIARLILDFRVR